MTMIMTMITVIIAWECNDAGIGQCSGGTIKIYKPNSCPK
jgi:hypothetical protein